MPQGIVPIQAVTERYVSNLLRDGQNAEFRVNQLQAQPFSAHEVHCGWYYECWIANNDPQSANRTQGVGPTPSAALRNALTKLGVTFR